MVKFLDLKGINSQHRQALIDACIEVIDSGWYIMGEKLRRFEVDFADYCGVKHCVGVANGLDALTLTLRAWKQLGVLQRVMKYWFRKYLHCYHTCDYRKQISADIGRTGA